MGPVPAGAYRYAFVVDGVPTLDPRNPATSEANTNAWSLVYVPGSDLFDTRPVPRGAVAEVTYYSDSLGMFRRMHVYTPPGYETSGSKYPVLYLLHGAGDSDDSWSTAGRAGFILDNLIAKKAAKDMIVVMPAGHTRDAGRRRRRVGGRQRRLLRRLHGQRRALHRTALPRGYRAREHGHRRAVDGRRADARHRHGERREVRLRGRLQLRASSACSPCPGAAHRRPAWSKGSSDWEKRNAAALADEKTKKGLKLFWFSTGKDDFLLQTTRSTVNLFKEYGYAPVYKESEGGHTWINWRDYLTEFAPLLFR